MRFGIGALAFCLVLAAAGGQSQDSSQLYYALQSLQAEVRTLHNRVQQLEVRQYDRRPREEAPDLEALRQQVSRLEQRVGQLESRAPAPGPPPAKPAPAK